MKYLFILLLLGGCSANHYLKKAERAIAKAEQLGAKVGADTVWRDAEFFIPESRIDTVINNITFRDTIRVFNDRVETKIKVSLVPHRIFVESKCKADTVQVEVPVTITKEISAGYSFWDLLGWIILIFIVATFTSPLVKRGFKILLRMP